MVVEAELVAEVADRAGAAPPLDVHGVEVDEPADGERGPRAEQRPADPAQLVAAQDQRAAEEVRDDGDEPVAEAVEDRLRARLSVEHILRDERVEADDGREREREPVDHAQREGELALADRVRRDARHGHCEQRLLPRLHDVDLPPAQPGVVEQRQHEVVEREPDDEDVERDDGAPPDGDRGRGERDAVEDEHERASRRALQAQEHLARVAVRRLGALVTRCRAEAGVGEPRLELGFREPRAAVGGLGRSRRGGRRARHRHGHAAREAPEAGPNAVVHHRQLHERAACPARARGRTPRGSGARRAAPGRCWSTR